MSSFIKCKKPIITISGATGTGKTSSSIQLALNIKKQYQIECEIINFDSIQFFKELDIASAKPTAEDLKLITHHLIGIKTIKEEMNASEFCKQAKSIISKLHKNDKVPILVGGSGFYLRAFVKGMFESTTVSEKTRSLIEKILKEEGSQGIRLRLREIDFESFSKLHHNDNYRNCRALEHWIETGTKFSEKSKMIQDPYDFSHQEIQEYNFLHFYALLSKNDHFPVLMDRTKSFFEENKIFIEVENILEGGANGSEKALQSIGYKEVISFLKEKGRQSPEKYNKQEIDQLIERVFISTRQLVKAQKTFYKKVHPKVTYNPISELSALIDQTFFFLNKLKSDV